ncbi:DUF3068 domain-containing protein [Planomonospora corallina]|uniref:DUF3068 domain-containing protein n=1 Tax=Planomonospora corallina TaxID=1806052 RepID=A0ABV8I6S5_9ACTN
MSGPRISWAALLAVGAFFLSFAALLRFQVYESVLALPLEQDRTYRLTTQRGAYFDAATLTSRTGVPLVSTTTLSGDVAAGDGGTAVWIEFTSLETAEGERIDYHERRSAFDRRTGMTVACCGQYVDEDAGVWQSGLAFRLPFRAEPRSYPMFDTVLRRSVPLRFEREEEVEGVRTYRYRYSAGPIRVENLPGTLPGEVMGLPGWRSVGVSRYVEVTRTLWVEPESGLTVKVEEVHRQALRTADEVERKVSLEAHLTMSRDDVAALAAEAGAFARWAAVVRDVLPGGSGALGAILTALALWLRRRTGPAAQPQEPSAAAQHEQQVPAHDLA